jgi:8-oxo-dGTP pyrophosphatase MutT (NUDIX family)
MSTDAFFRVWASAVIVDDEGRVLISHRRDRDLWNLPGGKIDTGELPVAGLRREVREETGLEVVVEQLVGVYQQPDGAGLTVSYRCAPAGGTLSPSEEADCHVWLAPRHFPVNTHPQHALRVRQALRHDGPPIEHQHTEPGAVDFLAALRAHLIPSPEPLREPPSGEVFGAIRHLVGALTHANGERGRLLLGLGELLRRSGDLDGADEALDEAELLLADAAERGRLAVERAAVLYHRGHHPEAEMGLWKALDTLTARPGGEADTGSCYEHLGRCVAEMGRPAEAAEYLERAYLLRQGRDTARAGATWQALVEVRRRSSPVTA